MCVCFMPYVKNYYARLKNNNGFSRFKTKIKRVVVFIRVFIFFQVIDLLLI